MIDELGRLIELKKIDHDHYETFMIFEHSELGKAFLKRIFEQIILEDPATTNIPQTYAFHDGRRSVWRDIKLIILHVKSELEKLRNE